MKLALRVALLLAVFLAAGWLTAHSVMVHASAATPVAEVRLSAWMAGLFAGGAMTVLAGIAMVWLRGGRSGDQV